MKVSNQTKVQWLKKRAQQLRKDILEISFKAKVGHIASALSIVDILAVLYSEILNLNPKNPLDPVRDRFILSKGHAAAALYAALHRAGFISRHELLTFCQNAGHFGVHPAYNPRLGIELSTGSLGHGLSVGAGMALGLKNSRIFVLISDAELNEGSTWEATMFAAQHQLDNLAVIVDDNNLQAFGRSHEVLNLRPLEKKWEAFGWEVRKVNGHNLEDLLRVLTNLPLVNTKPSAVIATTTGGKGVSFMEDQVEWHYWPLKKSLYQQALRDISNF